jgi:hypothetical protein
VIPLAKEPSGIEPADTLVALSAEPLRSTLIPLLNVNLVSGFAADFNGHMLHPVFEPLPLHLINLLDVMLITEVTHGVQVLPRRETLVTCCVALYKLSLNILDRSERVIQHGRISTT